MQGPGRHFGPGVTVLSQAVMCAEKSLEQRMASRIALAGALAEQWSGGLLVAATAADRWLEWGLQGYLQMLFIRTAYGSNEARYARIKQRDAVCTSPFGACCWLVCGAVFLKPLGGWAVVHAILHTGQGPVRRT